MTNEEIGGVSKYPVYFNKRVNLQLVNVPVIKQWISKELDKLIPDDDIIIEFVNELIFGADGGDVTSVCYDLSTKIVDPKQIQLQLVPFLDENAAPFVKKLWELLLIAQETQDGIPPALKSSNEDDNEGKERIIIPKGNRNGNRTNQDNDQRLNYRERYNGHTRGRDYRGRGGYRGRERHNYRYVKGTRDQRDERDIHTYSKYDNNNRSRFRSNRSPQRSTYASEHKSNNHKDDSNSTSNLTSGEPNNSKIPSGPRSQTSSKQ